MAKRWKRGGANGGREGGEGDEECGEAGGGRVRKIRDWTSTKKGRGEGSQEKKTKVNLGTLWGRKRPQQL